MKTFVRFLAFIWILWPAAVVAGNETEVLVQTGAASAFTIQQALSSPFPTNLVAAPAKGKLAWVFNAQGKRNVWVAEPAPDGKSYSAHQLTKYSQDDGQEIAELQFTPDAQSIIYVRGGDFESTEAPYPNPTGNPQGVEQDIWMVSANGGEPKKIAEGHSPTISPNGTTVAYIFKNQVWLAKLNGDTKDKPEQLIHSKGGSSSLRWSRDGRYLAFVSDRDDHSFIGVYALETKTLSYMEPSTDYDREPVWSPDSKAVAYLRVPSSKDILPFAPRRGGPPWSIRVADAATGKSREIWKASVGSGSVFREIRAENQIFWGASDRIVFPWELDGWTHLYSVPTKGGTATLLTPGSFEVEFVALSPDRKAIVYSSNQDDIDRRHLWKVAADGDKPSALTTGTGIETAPVVTSDNQTVAILHSDARTPLRPGIAVGPNDVRDLAPDSMPADFPAARMVTPQQVLFSAADGMQIHAQLFLPANAADGTRHPALVFFHGGSRRQMLLGWNYSNYYSNAYAMNQYMASCGYVVLAVNYRSGIGYGRDFREALNYGAAGASEFNDVLGAGLYLSNRADVDPKRIGLWGGSYGGYLTALGLARSSDLFAAGVDLHGVHDWNSLMPNFMPSHDPGQRADFARLAWESSPLSSVQTWRSPVLLIQGDDDRNVPFAETVTLADALRKQGVEYEELIFPDEIHDFLLWRNWIAAYSAASEFFDRHLTVKKQN